MEDAATAGPSRSLTEMRSERVTLQIWDSIRAIQMLNHEEILRAADIIEEMLPKKSKILLCGNGGSAADCQHIAAEFIGRFKKERQAFPAIALTTDTSILTALSNDYTNDIVFSRQVEALGQQGDILIAMSTSGSSPNIIKAAELARKKNMWVIGFTGKKGERLREVSNVCITVDSTDTPRIQEAHMTAAHIICSLVEESLTKK